MNTTPEERVEYLKRYRADTRTLPRWAFVLRLLDDADEADALRARAEAAEADNAALREALRKSAIRYESAASLWVTCSLCSRSWDTPGEHHEGCILAQPHPGESLRERLRMADAVVAASRQVFGDVTVKTGLPTQEPLWLALNAYDAAREAGQ